MKSLKLHTIGYEGCSMDDFISTLKNVGVETLVDIRDVPISRKRGFSKSKLSEILISNGISYIHLKGLGDPKAGRLAARSGKFEEFNQIFSKHMMTEVAQSDLLRLISIASETRSCLLCFERDHHNCHRSIISKQLSLKYSFQVQNIGVKLGIANKIQIKSESFHEQTASYVW